MKKKNAHNLTSTMKGMVGLGYIGIVPTLSSRQGSHLPNAQSLFSIYLLLQLHSLSFQLSLLDVPRTVWPLSSIFTNELAAWACAGVQVT